MSKVIRHTYTTLLLVSLVVMTACDNASETTGSQDTKIPGNNSAKPSSDDNTRQTIALYPKLWAAAGTGKIERVNALLDKGLDVNKPDLSGSTALIHASLGGYTHIIQLLLQHGAVVNSRENSMGLSALSAAAANNHKETVIVLLDAGANDFRGATNMAEKYYHKDMVRLLREKMNR